MQRSPRRKTYFMQGFILLAGCLILIASDPGRAKEPKRAPAGPLITIYTPHAEELELALDETELNWGADSATQTSVPIVSTIGVAGARLVKTVGQRSIVALPGANDISDLWSMASLLMATNRGAEAYLVLYEPGVPKSEATRRLLTREVGLLLEHEEDSWSVLSDVTVESVRAVPGVPGAYVIEARDPPSALDLVDVLHQHPKVLLAYPLLKRFRFAR